MKRKNNNNKNKTTSGRASAGEHPEFIKYKKFIATHPNYEGMPEPYTKNGSVRWVATKPSKIGQQRLRWWESRRQEGEALRDVAFRIHPTKEKPCQICGRVLQLDYVYPAKNRIQRISALLEKRGSLSPELKTYLEDEETMLTHIKDFLYQLDKLGGEQALGVAAEVFKVPNEVSKDPEKITAYLLSLPIRKRTGKLSPGAMSNAPDRFDGFHSYNLCHREEVDKGRSRQNLAKYGEDRRVYENWVDGEHKAASWVMKEFKKYGWSADHIGPISQGFTHRPGGFRPATTEFQSRRRDRLRAKDIQLLLEAEGLGEKVASWHVLPLWNALKECAVVDDGRAEALGKEMRRQVHDVLMLLYQLLDRGYDGFLRHLRKELFRSHMLRIGPGDIEIAEDVEEVNRALAEEGEFYRAARVNVNVNRSNLRAENKRNAYRTVRKSLEALRAYAEATEESVGSRRRLANLDESQVEELLEPVIEALEKGRGRQALDEAEKRLYRAISQLALEKAEKLKREWGCG